MNALLDIEGHAGAHQQQWAKSAFSQEGDHFAADLGINWLMRSRKKY